MKRNILIVVSVVGLVVMSACGTEAAPSNSNPLTEVNPPEVNTISTVAVINTAMANDGTAHSALMQFFDHLHTGRYEAAAALYGGSYQRMTEHNPEIDPSDHAALMKNACTINGSQCLKIKLAGIEYKPSPNEYLFTVQFQNDDGSLFELGPCCGASETEQPPVSLFEVRVTQVAEGQYRILDMPPYMP